MEKGKGKGKRKRYRKEKKRNDIEKKNKVGGLTLPCCQTYCKATAILKKCGTGIMIDIQAMVLELRVRN